MTACEEVKPRGGAVVEDVASLPVGVGKGGKLADAGRVTTIGDGVTLCTAVNVAEVGSSVNIVTAQSSISDVVTGETVRIVCCLTCVVTT